MEKAKIGLASGKEIEVPVAFAEAIWQQIKKGTNTRFFTSLNQGESEVTVNLEFIEFIIFPGYYRRP